MNSAAHNNWSERRKLAIQHEIAVIDEEGAEHIGLDGALAYHEGVEWGDCPYVDYSEPRSEQKQAAYEWWEAWEAERAVDPDWGKMPYSTGG